ncbi:MAG: FAD-binding oxidoreductase [Candidatus Uhrbacteria bacterium]|nr:FAD-binding oxidoreductase [Candidatus Uhrbacteria bacterium]
MSFPSTRTILTSFDGGVVLQASVQKPDKYRFFDSLGDVALIPRGAGLSYPAASFGSESTSVDLSNFNRLLSYQDGLLHVEAGATLGQVYNFLIKHGRYLPIQPGHPDITIGGCVAADVHGKNQLRDGTFIELVEALELFHPKHGVVTLSRTEHADLFYLTCGGYGLTGIIRTVHLRTRELPSPVVEIVTIPVSSVEDLEAVITEKARQYDLVYSWHDFTQRGKGFGKGFIKAARFVPSSEVASSFDQRDRHPKRTLYAEHRGMYRYAFFSQWTTRPFNALFYQSNMIGRSVHKMPLYDFLFPVHNKEIYFKFFGRKGFHECQFIIPFKQVSSWTEEVKVYLSGHSISVTLASAKLFVGEQRLLRFTGQGICMALDVPRSAQGRLFVDFLNDLATRTGAIPNIIKDAELSAPVVAACYPEYEAFRSALRAWDPDRMFRSHLSERIGL